MVYGYPPVQEPAPHRGLAIASLVLGVLGLVFAWVPALGLVLAGLATVFGGYGRRHGTGVAGLVMGILGLVFGVILLILIEAVASA